MLPHYESHQDVLDEALQNAFNKQFPDLSKLVDELKPEVNAYIESILVGSRLLSVQTVNEDIVSVLAERSDRFIGEVESLLNLIEAEFENLALEKVRVVLEFSQKERAYAEETPDSEKEKLDDALNKIAHFLTEDLNGGSKYLSADIYLAIKKLNQNQTPYSTYYPPLREVLESLRANTGKVDLLVRLVHDIGRALQDTVREVSEIPSLNLSVERLAQVIDFMVSQNRRLRLIISQVIINMRIGVGNLDKKDEAILQQKMVDNYIHLLISQSSELRETVQVFDDSLLQNWQYFYTLVVDRLMDMTEEYSPEQIIPVMAYAFNKIGFTTILERIKEREPDKYARIVGYLGIVSQEVLKESNDLYKIFDISNYNPNDELQLTEKALVDEEVEKQKSQTDQKIKILDAASGSTARHTAHLHEDPGVEAFAFDASLENLSQLKTTSSEVDAQLADWNNLPFADESFDLISLLGRSAHHATTPRAMSRMLSEFHRVLKTGGVMLMDLAKYGEGHYGINPQMVSQALDQVGIVNREPGILFDSPIENAVIQRFTPPIEQFMQLARLVGFKVEVVGEKEFKYGEIVNQNIYFKLTKVEDATENRMLGAISRYEKPEEVNLRVLYY